MKNWKKKIENIVRFALWFIPSSQGCLHVPSHSQIEVQTVLVQRRCSDESQCLDVVVFVPMIIQVHHLVLIQYVKQKPRSPSPNTLHRKRCIHCVIQIDVRNPTLLVLGEHVLMEQGACPTCNADSQSRVSTP